MMRDLFPVHQLESQHDIRKGQLMKKNGAFILSLLLIVTSVCVAQQYELKDPPQRVILNITQDPASSVAVTWRTLGDYPNSQVQITKASDWIELEKGALKINARKQEVVLRGANSVFHYSAVVSNLEPDILYAYRVGHDSIWSGWSQFRTAKAGQSPFTFVYFGDPQNNLVRYCSRVFHEAFRKSPEARFWLFVGDIIGEPQHDSLWSELFTSLGFIPTMIPFALVPGNHEYPNYEDTGARREIVPLWRPHFTLPMNGVKGLEETSYYFDYQGVRFIMLNGEEKLDEQARWMESLLASNPNKWTIASLHHPLFSMGGNRDEYQTRDAFMSLFDKYGVDLVLAGHDHVYSRSHKLRNGAVVPDSEKGTVYVVSVSGSKAYPLSLKYKDLMIKIGEKVQLFQTISIDGNTLAYKSHTVTRALYDSFELKK
jgi:hypothetical protein